MINRNFKDFKFLHKRNKNQIIYTTKKIKSDSEIINLINNFLEEKNSFVFESVEKGIIKGRYTIFGKDPDKIWEFNNNNCILNYKNRSIKLKGSPKDNIEKIIENFKFDIPKNLPPISSILSGYFSYDIIRYIEKIPNRTKNDLIRVALLLLVSLAIGGIIYQSTQTALPKHFTNELKDWSLQLFGAISFDTKSATGLGLLVSIVYSSSIVMQYVGGALADRYSLKNIYIICWFLQIVMLAAIAATTGLGLLGAALLAVAVNITMLPAENMLIYKYAPSRHRSLIFGIKFVITFGAAPASVALVAYIQEVTNALDMLFLGLAAATLVVALLMIFLPQDKSDVSKGASAK